MTRYTRLLREGYESAGFDVRVLTPSAVLSRRIRFSPVRKFVAYVEQLVLFPLRLAFTGKREVWHVADHSDAVWLAMFPRRRSIVTCHDLIALRAARGEVAEHRTRWSGRLYQWLVSVGVRQASLIEAVSNATLGDVARLFPRTAVATVHNPLDPEFVAASDATSRSDAERSFVVVVSSSGWRKRREHALAVWRRLREADPAVPLGLVVIGPPLTETELSSVPVEDRPYVTVRSGVTDPELAGIYRDALAVLQVSLHEGFGWPILEANSLGTPAICSPLEVFREVAGPDAVFISDALEFNDWRRIRQLLASERVRESAAINARRFSMRQFSSDLDENWSGLR